MGEKQQKRPISLLGLVITGVVSSLIVVGGLFLLFAAYEAQAWLFWLAPTRLDQDTLFGVGRNAVTLAAALGVGVTLFFSYRKQQTAENAQELAVRAQNLAMESQDLATKTLQLSLEKHELESVSELRNRYARSAEQLSSDKTSVRLAGVHSLIALSDDWRAVGKADEQQVCISLLCSYMNTLQFEHTNADDLIKATGVEAISARLVLDESSPNKCWQQKNIELTGVFFQHGLANSTLDGGQLRLVDCNWNSMAMINSLNVRGGLVSITSNGPAHRALPEFRDGKFEGGRVVLRGGVSELSPTARFLNCDFNGANVDLSTDSRTFVFSRCTFSAGKVTILPSYPDTRVKFLECTFLSSDVVSVIQTGDTPVDIRFSRCEYGEGLEDMARFPQSKIISLRNIRDYLGAHRPSEEDSHDLRRP